jgi:hypothetical protein
MTETTEETEEVEEVESLRIRFTKWCARNLVAAGTTYVIATSANRLIQPQTKVEKTLTYAGAWGISGIVADQTSEYTDRYIDDFVTQWNENKQARLEYEKELAEVEVPNEPTQK